MFRRFALGALVLLLPLAAAVPAVATTGTGEQNPSLFVTASLTPDEAFNYEAVTATASVANRSAKKQPVAITVSLTAPDGSTVSHAQKIVLAAGETWTQSATRDVQPGDPRGTYTLSVTAEAKGGTSSASAETRYV